MRKILLLSVVLFWLLPGRGTAQITIHPEVGVSYLRFQLKYRHFLEEPGKIDPVFGIAAQMPVHPDWYMKSRITFCKRADKIYSGWGFQANFNEYSQSELNIELSFNYRITNFLEAGLGPSLTRSFVGVKNIYLPSLHTIHYDFNQFFLGINSGASIVLGRFGLHMTYARLFRETSGYSFTVGKNRFDLTVSYHLLGGNKEKKK